MTLHAGTLQDGSDITVIGDVVVLFLGDTLDGDHAEAGGSNTEGADERADRMHGSSPQAFGEK